MSKQLQQEVPKPASIPRRKNYQSFEIGGWLPQTKNKVLGPRGSWILQNDKQTTGHFGNEFRKLNHWPQAEVKKHVKVTIQKGPMGKVEDYDNFIHYLKSILDALHIAKTTQYKYGCGLIVNDSPRWCEWEIEQTWGPQRAVRIEIWDAP